ncbi:MAG: hypothetical protein Unbinned202contig1002_44 [Prokaryotic dsDNA virus sp.]|nr:MAG: hypothetical protein Unbinned202contig1002_44 [Prokaryotic dsDNA virus sp.]|tara:strand:+ start:19459 stop:19833 length:375 start_codon:yes stop_codon:yes gene_type:complete
MKAIKLQAEPFKKVFLDYLIVNTWNNDDFVLKSTESRLPNDPHFYECHLGNYSTVEDAMESAVTYFMMKRIDVFHKQIHHRTLGTKTWGEWFVFSEILVKEGLPMPNELKSSSSYTIELRQERS